MFDFHNSERNFKKEVLKKNKLTVILLVRSLML